MHFKIGDAVQQRSIREYKENKALTYVSLSYSYRISDSRHVVRDIVLCAMHRTPCVTWCGKQVISLNGVEGFYCCARFKLARDWREI
jgi:hypothetical protein